MFFVPAIRSPRAAFSTRIASFSLCAVAALSATAPVNAAEKVLEDIVVTGSLVERIGATCSVTVIDSDSLGLLRPNHMNETLALVPGTEVSRGSGRST